jgi:hypothetical protein
MRGCRTCQAAWILTCFSAAAMAQPSEPLPYSLHSGLCANPTREFVSVYVGRVEQLNVPWMRVHVGDHNLGKRSYVVFTSLEDGERLRHNAKTLDEWAGWSAFFNGDAVDVELFIAPAGDAIFVNVDNVLVGIRESLSAHGLEGADAGEGNARDLCGSDDRVTSSARRIGRFINNSTTNPQARCTGWICANGAILTAGHCDPIVNPSFPVLEFDINSSDCDGTVNFGSTDHQYAVDLNSINSNNNGLGDDWAILAVFPNPNTNLMPAYGENAFARLARDLNILNPSTVRVAGCGADSTPTGCTGSANSDNRTRQTSSDDFDGEFSDTNGTWLEHRADTTTGSSGSPIVDVASDLAIGIHTTGLGCPNGGSSFNHNPLEFAINTFPGANTVYVDQGHPIGLQTGKIFRPWLLLDPALADVPSGGILSIVEGDYTLTSGVINQAVTITAPVGSVTIHP